MVLGTPKRVPGVQDDEAQEGQRRDRGGDSHHLLSAGGDQPGHPGQGLVGEVDQERGDGVEVSGLLGRPDQREQGRAAEEGGQPDVLLPPVAQAQDQADPRQGHQVDEGQAPEVLAPHQLDRGTGVLEPHLFTEDAPVVVQTYGRVLQSRPGYALGQHRREDKVEGHDRQSEADVGHRRPSPVHLAEHLGRAGAHGGGNQSRDVAGGEGQQQEDPFSPDVEAVGHQQPHDHQRRTTGGALPQAPEPAAVHPPQAHAHKGEVGHVREHRVGPADVDR